MIKPKNILNKKTISIILILTYLVLALNLFNLLGNQYHAGVWSFKNLYVSEQLQQNSFISQIDFGTIADTTFYSLEGHVNNYARSKPALEYLFVVLAFFMNVTPLFLLKYPFLALINTIGLLFLYVIIKDKKQDYPLLMTIIILFLLNPIMLFLLPTASGFIFFALMFTMYIIYQLMKSKKISWSLMWFFVGILFYILVMHIYNTASYILSTYLFSTICILILYALFSHINKNIEIEHSIKKQLRSKNIIFLGFILLAGLIILIVLGIGPFALIKYRFEIFADIIGSIKHFLTYYLSHKLLSQDISSTMSLTFVQSKTYLLSLMSFLFYSMIVYLIYLYNQFKKIKSHKMILSNTTYIIHSYMLMLMLLFPLLTATNSLDRLPWLITFGLCIIIPTLYKENKKYIVLFYTTIIVCALVFIPLYASSTNMYQIYDDRNINTYDTLMKLTPDESIIWSDLKSSSYLINNNRRPMTIVSGSYQGTNLAILVRELYYDVPKFMSIIDDRGAEYMLITKDMTEKVFYSFNFHLKPINTNITNSMNNISYLDKIYDSGDFLYSINKETDEI